MAADSDKLLASIPALAGKQDAAALAELKKHADKRVRKAAGKALHGLKSKGVAVAADDRRAWTPGDTLAKMRGDLQPAAMADTDAVPGALRFMLSVPRSHSGAALWVGTLSPGDRVLEFGAYSQTDGQRARMLRDWQGVAADRQLPADWIKARIRWARDKTLAAGFSVPRALDEALTEMGELPTERPPGFLAEILGDTPALDESKVDAALIQAGVPRWPPLVDLDGTLQRAAEIHGDKPQPTEDAERIALLRQSAEGDEKVREAMRGSLSVGLEDAAVGRWLLGDEAGARTLVQVAKALRESEAPEGLEFAVRILGYQVASLLRAVGGPEAVQRMQAQAAAQGQSHSHAHDHDHDHDHDHHDHHDHDHG